MRIATIRDWIFVGFGLLTIGMLLYMFEVTQDGKLAIFLTLIGSAYVIIGVVLTVMHDRHMAKRWRARLE